MSNYQKTPMSDFRLFMWMMFGVTIVALLVVCFGNEFAQNAAGGVLGGVGMLAFITLFGKGMP